MAFHSLEKPVRHRRKEARPSELTAAALELFVERGYSATRLDDVAARAGVSKGTLYIYFDSKEALFSAVIREGLLSALAGEEKRVANYTGCSADLLRTVVRGFWRMVGTKPIGGLPKLIFAEAENFPKIARFYHDEVIARGVALMRAVLTRGIARGEFHTRDPDAAAHILIAPLLMRVVWKHSLGRCGVQGVPTERYLAEYLQMMVGGLYNGDFANRRAQGVNQLMFSKAREGNDNQDAFK